MAAVSSRSHGLGLPPEPQLSPANPFDSDDDMPATAYVNPFDIDDSPAKPSGHVAKGSRLESSKQSSGTHDSAKPLKLDDEVTANPKTPGERVLDEGALFDGDEDGKPVKERKSTTRAFATMIAEGGSRIKESASSSLSSVKLPSLSSSSASKGFADAEKGQSKRLARSKHQQQSKELFGEPAAPGYHNNYFSQSDQSRFSGQTVEELEQCAVAKSQDTTSSIRNAIRIAEDTKAVATTTLETLHIQADQIRRTHDTAVLVDEELGRGEKVLGSLGGMFSMTWKPKKAHKITGPQVDPEQYARKNNLGERSALGLNFGETAARPRPQISGMSSAQAQLELEKNTQDEGLSDLSNVLGQLKGMTLEMGHELERQNGDLDRMHDDVHELTARVKGANNRTQHLLNR